MLESLFNKVAALKASNFIKRYCNTDFFQNTTFFTEHLRWLLLSFMKCRSRTLISHNNPTFAPKGKRVYSTHSSFLLKHCQLHLSSTYCVTNIKHFLNFNKLTIEFYFWTPRCSFYFRYFGKFSI